MCGIVGYVGKRNAQDVLLDGLEKLEYRGYDSAGVALALEGGIRVVKSKGRLAELRKRLAVEALARSGCGIGHTRWATHGEPSDVNSHPHSTPRVSIVHNGIIENYGVLKERLMAKGYTFESETDTEVLVKLIDSCYEGEPLKALRAALAMVRGSYALAVLFRDFPDTLFAVKRESPLIVGWGEEENFIASDIPALLKYTRRYSVLEEGDMAVVNADGIRFYNEFAEPVEREVLTANWDQEAAEKGGYPHFMLKEINEQPAAITATVSPRVENGLPDLRVPELTDERLRRIGTVHLVGCGTAMHAGMVGKAAIEALARVPAQVEIASEFRYRNPILRPEDLVIIISQSGETSDTLAALKLAKSRGVPVLAIVNVVGSSIARAADYVMYTYAGPEIAVASTKAYMVQMCVLYLFALRLAYARGMQTDAEIRRLTAELLRAGEVIKPRLADCEQIKYLASRFVNTQSCFFIGRGFDYSLSLEGSLKLKEISYVHSDAYAAGELKHGTISLVTDGVPVIALATQKQVYEKTISNAKETKSRGVPVLAIVNVVGSSIARAADYVMYTYAGPEIAVASTKAYMVQMCVLYLFALRLAYARGMQTDAEIRRLTAELLRAGEVIKPRLADCEQIKYLASRFVNTQSCFFIGRGFDYSLSLEGSLKLKEISYVHSDAYAAGELKHGTISLVTDGVPVIALATQKQVYEKTISNAKETKSRGAKVLLFTTRDAVVPDGVADYVVRLDDYDDLLMPLQLIVPLQLFAYYMAVLRGCDVDKPRNLAKSVTVE